MRLVWRTPWPWLGVILLATLLTRTWVEGRTELQAGRRAEAARQTELAIVHYRRAAQWYMPGSPTVTEALRQLRRIGTEFGRRSASGSAVDPARALMAWRAIRAAILSTRSFYTPHRAELAEADQHIASLMASLPAPPIDAGKSFDQLRREHLALLRGAVRQPAPWWSACALLGFAAWVGGALTFFRRGRDANGTLIRREAQRWGGCVLAGVVLFIVGLSLA